MEKKITQIFDKYEDILLKNLKNYENDKEINPEALQDLNDGIRILHRIQQMRSNILQVKTVEEKTLQELQEIKRELQDIRVILEHTNTTIDTRKVCDEIQSSLIKHFDRIE